jgi:hypothetical protein
MKRRMVERRSEKNVDGRGRGPFIFADFPFHPSEPDYLVPQQFSMKLLISRSYPLICPAWVTLPVATLPPA